MSKELVKAGSTELATVDYGDDAAQGFENQSAKDLTIPWVVLLQSLSPPVSKETISGAKAGMWCNVLTEQIYTREEGMLFVPAYTIEKVGIWTPRTAGGGFHGHMEVDDPRFLAAVKRSKEFGKYEDDEGHQLVDTFYVYGITCTEEGDPDSMCCIAFKSTMIKPYRRWNTRLSQFRLKGPRGLQRPPLYAHLTRLTSFMDKKPKGEFYVPQLRSADPRGLKESLLSPDDDRFIEAKRCYELVSAGQASANYEKQQDAGESDDSGDNAFG